MCSIEADKITLSNGIACGSLSNLILEFKGERISYKVYLILGTKNKFLGTLPVRLFDERSLPSNNDLSSQLSIPAKTQKQGKAEKYRPTIQDLYTSLIIFIKQWTNAKESYRFFKLDNWPQFSGIEPLNLLFARFRISKCTISPRKSGNKPDRLLFCNSLQKKLPITYNHMFMFMCVCMLPRCNMYTTSLSLTS